MKSMGGSDLSGEV
ncbi:unnamed protein product, partial [Arctia plantaginis]